MSVTRAYRKRLRIVLTSPRMTSCVASSVCLETIETSGSRQKDAPSTEAAASTACSSRERASNLATTVRFRSRRRASGVNEANSDSRSEASSLAFITVAACVIRCGSPSVFACNAFAALSCNLPDSSKPERSRDAPHGFTERLALRSRFRNGFGVVW